jgi:putative ABC transport system permease protein
VKVQTPSEVGDDFAAQIQAFNIVLYFFSGIALFVGGFLILNSFNMTVLQRMREIGTLRTLGATRGAVVRTVMIEALALGVVGAVAGLALGIGMAVGLVSLMRGMGMPIGGLRVAPSAAVLSVAVGLLVTVLGSLRPALRAGSVPPIQAVLTGRGKVARPRLRRAALGLALFVPGLVFGGEFWFGDGAGDSFLLIAAGMIATMAMFAGMAVAAPFMIMPLVRLFAAPLKRIAPTGGRLAADAAFTNPARTAATAAALTIGLSVFVVNAGMSTSFMGSIHDQIDTYYARDFTIQPLGTPIERGGEQIVPRSLKARVADMPGTQIVTPVRATLLDLPGVEGTKQGLAVAFDPRVYGEVDKAAISGASRADALRGVARGGVIVGPQYARQAHLQVGDHVTLRGAAGTRTARVAGVLHTMSDFNGELIQMSLATMRDVYGVTDDAQLAVKARTADDRVALEHRIAALVDRDYPNLELLSAAEVKRSIDDQISQQFGLLNAIVAIAVIVSLLGVINTLAMSVIERTREIGVLRALGSSRWQVRLTMLNESLLITLSGSIAGLAVGALIARVWVGGLETLIPGIAFHFPLVTAVGVAVAAVTLGVLAAILPARRAARLKPIEAISYE